jgi:hypothetical protein
MISIALNLSARPVQSRDVVGERRLDPLEMGGAHSLVVGFHRSALGVIDDIETFVS